MLVMQQPGVFCLLQDLIFKNTWKHSFNHLNTDITEAVCTEGQSRKIYSVVAVAATIKKGNKRSPQQFKS